MTAPGLPEALVGALSESEIADRAMVMAQGGRIAARMRAAEAAAWPPGMLAEVWRWAVWLCVLRGYRGQTTGANYASALMRLGEWIVGQTPPVDWRDLTLEHLEAWLKALYVQRRLGKSARSVATSGVKSFYRWRSARGRGRDCSFGLSGPKVDRRKPRRHTPAELRAIFAAIDQAMTPDHALRDRALLLLLLSTGARREEASGLRLQDITVDGRIAVARIRGKGAKERDVAFEGPAVKHLLAWIERRKELGVAHDRLFCNLKTSQTPLAPGGVEKAVKRYCRRAGVRHSGVHVFRVTFATQLYDDGTDIERIRIVLGHESIETTRQYIAISNRQRSVRLKPHRQHAALGTFPEGMPRWAKAIEEQGHA